MKQRQPRYTKEEHARLGMEIYEHDLRALVEPRDHGKIIAIDVDTRAYEIAEDTLTAADRLLARYPDAQIWVLRIGHRGVHRFGAHVPAEAP